MRNGLSWSVRLLVTDTETVAELEQAGVAIVTADSHQAALLVDFGAIEGLVRHLGTYTVPGH